MEFCRLSIAIQNLLSATEPTYQDAYLAEKTGESTPVTAKGKEKKEIDSVTTT